MADTATTVETTDATTTGTGTNQEQDATEGQEPEEAFDKERAMSTIRKLREQANAATKAIKQYEQQHKEAELAKLSETERLTKKLAELEAADQQRATAAQERVLRAEIKAQAAALHIIDPDAAFALLDRSKIAFDADGEPIGIDDAIKALAKAKPYLVQAPDRGQQTSATNPGTRATTVAGSRRYTRAEIADRDTYVANKADILKAMAEGRIDD